MTPTNEQIQEKMIEIFAEYLADSDCSCGICKYGDYCAEGCGGNCAKHILESVKQMALARIGKPSLTEDERVILKNIPSCYRWIARDSADTLVVSRKEPHKLAGAWVDGESMQSSISKPQMFYLTAFSHLFTFINWEDELPYSIGELLR